MPYVCTQLPCKYAVLSITMSKIPFNSYLDHTAIDAYFGKHLA